MVQILQDTPFESELNIYFNGQFIEVYGMKAVQLINQEMFGPLLRLTLDFVRFDIINWNINENCMLVWTPESPRGR